MKSIVLLLCIGLFTSAAFAEPLPAAKPATVATDAKPKAAAGDRLHRASFRIMLRAKALRSKDATQRDALNKVLGDRDLFDATYEGLHEEYETAQVGHTGPLQDFFAWLIENQESIFALIMKLISLFSADQAMLEQTPPDVLANYGPIRRGRSACAGNACQAPSVDVHVDAGPPVECDADRAHNNSGSNVGASAACGQRRGVFHGRGRGVFRVRAWARGWN